MGWKNSSLRQIFLSLNTHRWPRSKWPFRAYLEFSTARKNLEVKIILFLVAEGALNIGYLNDNC